MVVAGELSGRLRAERSVVGETQLAAALQALAAWNCSIAGRQGMSAISRSRELRGVRSRQRCPRSRLGRFWTKYYRESCEALHGSALAPLIGRKRKSPALLAGRAQRREGQLCSYSGEKRDRQSTHRPELEIASASGTFFALFLLPLYQDSALFQFKTSSSRVGAGTTTRLRQVDNEALLARARNPEVSYFSRMLSLRFRARHRSRTSRAKKDRR